MKRFAWMFMPLVGIGCGEVATKDINTANDSSALDSDGIEQLSTDISALSGEILEEEVADETATKEETAATNRRHRRHFRGWMARHRPGCPRPDKECVKQARECRKACVAALPNGVGEAIQACHETFKTCVEGAVDKAGKRPCVKALRECIKDARPEGPPPEEHKQCIRACRDQMKECVKEKKTTDPVAAP